MQFESLIFQSKASNPEESSHIPERSNFLNPYPANVENMASS